MTTDPVPPVIWRPDPDRVPTPALTAFARFVADRDGADVADYGRLWTYSTERVADFWSAVAEFFDVRWHQPPRAPAGALSMPGADWFPGGTLNYAEHALRGSGCGDDDVAVIAEAEDGSRTELTWAQLRARVGAAQVGLRRFGVGPGDRVVGLVPNTVAALVGFLATAALGAVWSSCSPDFGAPSVIDRFTQVSPTVLLAVDGYRYGGKEFRTADTVAAVRAALPSLAGVVHIPDLGTAPADGAIAWSDFTGTPAAPEFTPVPFSAPLWILYSSGTTGLPKPIVHSVGGILLEHLKSLRLQWDLGPGDRFLWFTTTGWMMWNFLVGGLLVGATVVLYDGSPAYPDLLALWRLVETDRVTVFGVSAAFVTACAKAEISPSAQADLGRLKALGSTGSPLSADGFEWLDAHVRDDLQIVSFSGGTDLCTGIVGGAPTVPVWKGEISCRALGAKVESFSPDAASLTGAVGELVITAPMPSMPVFFWGDESGERMRESYFADYPGVWRHGDWIRITDRGSCVIEGRSDATLNRGGIRMGTAEFYRVVEAVPQIADSLVIDTSTGSVEGDLLLFVVLADGADLDAVATTVRSRIRRELSPRHVPGRVVPVPSLPRTLNGKKCEVPVKRILAGMPPEQAVSRDALADPDAFDEFLAIAREAAGR